MAGVWVFKDGVYRLVKPGESDPGDRQRPAAGSSRRKVLVHIPTNEVITSYDMLERKLRGLGWERYFGPNTQLLQFHKRTSVDLISLPRDFSSFKSTHMYDIVVKNRNVFVVRDV